jgi:hypothetical protein
MSNHLTKYQFQKGQPSPHPEGRPKALKTILNLEFGISQTQCNELILSMLAMTKEQIEKESNNPESPMFTRIIGKAMIKSYNNGSLYALESLLNRSIGLPKQQIDTTLKAESPIFVTLNLDV